MIQQQFKIRGSRSISVKLLLLNLVLLALPIFFLNYSASRLFEGDKKQYVYDSQAVSSALAGREFVTYLDTALATLKIILGYVDLSQPLSVNTKNTIQFYLDNQGALVGTELYSVNPATRRATLAHQQYLPAALEKIGIKAADVSLDPAVFEKHGKEMEARGFFFRNASKPGMPPMLAIVLADNTRLKTKGYQALAVGYVSLKHFLSGTASSSNFFAIADRQGSLLFHSDVKQLYANASVAADEIFQEAWNQAINKGAKEYVNEAGARLLGSYYKPGLDLVAISQIDYDKALKATRTLTGTIRLIALGALAVMTIIGLLFSRRLTAPLKRLVAATQQVSSGNFDVKLPVTSKDEIGALSNSFVAMSRKISELIQEMVDKVRVDQELQIAKTVQQSLFPPTIIQNENLTIVSHYQSASECGGDWWGYFQAGQKHILAIADATGHGLPSALMTASARSCFSVIEKLSSDQRYPLDPSDMLKVANRVVYESAQGKIMMTFFICVIDFAAHVVTYASAAHNPPWLFSPQQGSAFKMTSLVSKGQRLGENRDMEAPELKTVPFQAGDTLVLYTDGLLEGKDLKGNQYGKKQARHMLEGAMKSDPQKITNELITDFMSHNSGKALDDDVTLAIVRLQS